MGKLFQYTKVLGSMENFNERESEVSNQNGYPVSVVGLNESLERGEKTSEDNSQVLAEW